MRYRWIRKSAWLGLGLSATVAVILSGCGGETADKSDAVLINAPDAKASIGRSAPSGGGPKAPAEAPVEKAPTSTTGAAPVMTAEGWGTLKGRVVYGGTPPQPAVKQAVGKAEKNPEVCAKDQPIMDEHLVVNSGNKGVKNVFVYLQRPTAVNEEAKKEAQAKHLEFDQKNCTYIPHSLGVMTGETVTLKSSDPTNHNVNFQLKNFSQNPLLAPGNTMDVKLDSAERTPGPVTCSIHPWMQAYWLVLDHPYFAVTDENGNFEIKNAPAGTQRVVVWQEAGGFVTPASGEAVNIKPNDTTSQEFTVDPGKFK
jgi:plastocyanin